MKTRAAYVLATRLMDEHLDKSWTLEFTNRWGVAAYCHGGEKKIGLNVRHIRNSPTAEVRDSILHEIAHALVGASHSHDQVWAQTAVELGGSARIEANTPDRTSPVVGLYGLYTSVIIALMITTDINRYLLYDMAVLGSLMLFSHIIYTLAPARWVYNDARVWYSKTHR